jgi:hypothetical protein
LWLLVVSLRSAWALGYEVDDVPNPSEIWWEDLWPFRHLRPGLDGQKRAGQSATCTKEDE